MLAKGHFGRLREFVGGDAHGVKLSKQREYLLAEGMLDEGQLVGEVRAEDRAMPLGLTLRSRRRRRPVRSSASVICVRVSRGALAGVGAAFRSSRAWRRLKPFCQATNASRQPDIRFVPCGRRPTVAR
ncbi:hypothetical protein ACFXA3_03290 [Streptomyces sp. NPDC059456]|uniref:hypothetical protein n=1 Tax=Streptomyces sp. NPDC059456 TaxID=3346838 RepID=UPI0036CFA5AB